VLTARNLLLPIVIIDRRCYHMGMTKIKHNTGTTADLRKAIEASDKSNRKIEREAGLAVGTVSRFVRGMRNITLGAAERVAEALGYRLRLVRERKPKKGGE